MSRFISIFAVIVAVFVVTTSIYGGYHFYSPVPFWDQWDGQVGFYQRFSDNALSALWGQHNEHRIVFSRLLFLIDRAIFDGGNAFLIVMNYVIQAGTSALFIREYVRNGAKEIPVVAVGAVIAGMLFLWTQENNLSWGFQSGSLGVNLFAVWAFAQFSREGDRTKNVTAAILLLIAAMLTMGNGVVGFAVLIGMAFLQRRPFREYVVVAICGVLAATAYYHNYSAHEVPKDTGAALIFLVQPKYFVMFLGSPVYYAHQSLMTAAVAGIVSFALFSGVALYVFVAKQMTPYRAFLIGTYAFVVISAAGATHSRWMMGLSGAIASRYTSPALIGMLAGILLVFDVLRGRHVRGAFIAALVVLMTLSTYQQAVRNDAHDLYYRKLALLGMKIGLDDPDADAMVYPAYMHDLLIKNAQYGEEHRVGIYNAEWLSNAGKVEFDPALTDASRCIGHFEATSASSGKITASGWATDGQQSDLLILLVDSANRTVGYGVTGLERPDVADAVSAAPRDAGWMGLADIDRGPIFAYVYTQGKFCRLP